MSRAERVAAHVGQIHALLQCIINECDAAQTEAFDYLYMSDAANKQSEKLKTENAKLRELAKAAWSCVNRRVSCDECRMSCGGCTLQSAMRELGIELD